MPKNKSPEVNLKSNDELRDQDLLRGGITKN